MLSDCTGKVIGYVTFCCWLQQEVYSQSASGAMGMHFSRKIFLNKVEEHPQKWLGRCYQI